MWRDDESRELQKRISEMSNEELLRMVNVEFEDYVEDALDYARAELDRRGVSSDAPADDQETAQARACPTCGGPSRLGVLFADRELTVVFADNNEERFVQVYACSRCGQVQLVADFQTDVQE
jgi:ribosomal protein S27AE